MSTMILVLAVLVLSGIPACGKVEKTTENETVLKNTSSPEKPGMHLLKNYTSWEELEEQGILWVEDGKLQTDIDYVNDGNYLTRDLKGTFVFPNEQITTIGERVFDECAYLSEIKIPDGVTTIEEYAFAGCIGVKEIQIPDSVTYIGTNAFGNVEKITYKGTAFYNPDNQYWGAKAMNDSGYVQTPELTTTVDGVKYTYRKYNGNESQVVITKIENAGEDYVIPSVLDGFEVCKIGNGEAVMADTVLKKLTIPSGNIYIGDRAFYQCRTLREIEWEKDTFNGRIGKEAFYLCDIRELNLPYMKDMETQIERHAFAANLNLEAVHFDKRNENVNIGTGWFSECSRSEIFVPENAGIFRSQRQWKTGKVHLLGTETKLKLEKIEKAKEGPHTGMYVEAEETKSEDFRYFTYYKKFVVPENAKALSDLGNTYYGKNFNSLKKVRVIEKFAGSDKKSICGQQN